MVTKASFVSGYKGSITFCWVMKTDLSPCVGILVARCLRHWLAKPCPELSVLMVLSSVWLLLGLRDLASVNWGWVILCHASHHTLFSINYRVGTAGAATSHSTTFQYLKTQRKWMWVRCHSKKKKKKKYTFATARTYWAHLCVCVCLNECVTSTNLSTSRNTDAPFVCILAVLFWTWKFSVWKSSGAILWLLH